MHYFTCSIFTLEANWLKKKNHKAIRVDFFISSKTNNMKHKSANSNYGGGNYGNYANRNMAFILIAKHHINKHHKICKVVTVCSYEVVSS